MNKYAYCVFVTVVCIVDAKCVYQRLDGSYYLPPPTDIYYGNCTIATQDEVLPRFSTCVNDTAFTTDCFIRNYEFYMGVCDLNMRCLTWMPAYLPLVDFVPIEQPSQVVACIANKQVFEIELSKYDKNVAVAPLYFNTNDAGYYVLIVNLLPFDAYFNGSISLYDARQRLLLSDYTETSSRGQGHFLTYYQHYRKDCTKAQFTLIAAGNIDVLTGIRSSLQIYQQF